MSHTITKIIDGLRYNTLTATEVCNFESSNGSGDFRYEDTSLYLSPRGRFFLAGFGGPLSRRTRPSPISGESYFSNSSTNSPM